MLSSCVDVARGLRIGRGRDALSAASCTHVGRYVGTGWKGIILSQGRVSQEDNKTEKEEGKKGRGNKRALGGERASWRQASIRFDAMMEVEMGGE